MAGSDGPGSSLSDPTAGQLSAERKPVVVRITEVRPDGYDGTCLRPLGLCELGGSCDACWYSPDHPRFKNRPD